MQGSIVANGQKLGVAFGFRRLVILNTLKSVEAGTLGQRTAHKYTISMHPSCYKHQGKKSWVQG